MKRLSVLLMACMTFSCIVTSSAQDVKLGAAGFLASTNWSQKFDDAKARMVLGLGGAGQYSINDKLNIGAELMYSAIGAAIVDDGDGLEGRISIKTIQIPLFASYEVTDELQIHAGLQPAFFLSVNAIIDGGHLDGKYDQSDSYGSSNVDFIIGGSYDITDKITGVLRINAGLKDVETERESRDLKTTGVQIGVRYWFVNK